MRTTFDGDRMHEQQREEIARLKNELHVACDKIAKLEKAFSKAMKLAKSTGICGYTPCEELEECFKELGEK